MNKKYWQNFGELTQSEAFQKSTEKEFAEELLPIEELESEGLLDIKTPRRDFLKYLGFSTAAAAIAASCEMPVRKSVPYLQKLDDLVAGVANYYASTYVNSGDAISVVVKQRDGRPIKIEGNEKSPLTNGGTSAQCQASVLDLYDPTRLRHPLQRTGNDYKEVTSFDAIDGMVMSALAGLGGKPIVLLTSTINSPSTLKVIEGFLAKYSGSRHVQYDALSHSGALQANRAAYGKAALPFYRFDKAKTIVSLGADFLGAWLSPAMFNYQYSQNRKIASEAPRMSRHIQFESIMSLTGSNADDRYTHKPSQTGAVALALLAKVGGSVTAPSLPAGLQEGVNKAAETLLSTKGESLVVCGSNDANIQMIVNAINEAVGANGNTINFNATLNTRKGLDTDMEQLMNDMAAGNIGALLIHDCNPVYSYYNGRKFAEALGRVPVSVSFNLTMNETAEQCKYIIPSHHWLESWGDAEPVTGYVSILQPIIYPLFKTRPFQSSLLKWSGMVPATTVPTSGATVVNDSTARMMPVKAGSGDPYENFHKDFWAGKVAGSDAWYTLLQDGVAPITEPSASAAGFNGGGVAAAAAAIAATKSGNYEVVLYPKVSIGNGSQANNPWLQEMPDPISKVTWDNYAMVSPALAKTMFDIDVANVNSKKDADKYEVHPEKPVLKISVNGRDIKLPAMIIPGMEANTIGIAVGYGRQSANTDAAVNYDRIGRAAYLAGQNAYPLLSWDGANYSFTTPVTVSATGDTYPLAQTQVHGFTESRPVIYETNLSSFIKDPERLLEEPTKERAQITPFEKTNFRRDATIYPDFVKPGIKWGMSIDLNSCTGCSACVIACTAENNVSVVGKMQVQRYHDMQWLRIDRYFTGNPDNPDVVFQPMLCQHCDNAPCENVCPVSATNHSSEGLNQMAYNRCIGTRYCANNCPYKVRRFNWLDYNGADSFPDNQMPLIGVDTNQVTIQMNDELTRMVLNPDVTVRSRGVMEKCTFCVQRLQEVKLEAKKMQDPSHVRNVNVACAQACPTRAISFGNVNDQDSDVYQIRNTTQVNRSFYVLEQLHVLPNVSYLAKIKNSDRSVMNEQPDEVEKGQIGRSEKVPS